MKAIDKEGVEWLVEMDVLQPNLETRTMKEEIVRESGVDSYVVDFGKNGQGITNELVLIGKRIEDLSEYYNVYMSSDSFIDAADDVYTLKFILSPKKEEQ
jgi:hypothetical protein